jgi:hypothetical protein
MTTNNTMTSPIRRRFGRSLRSTLLPFAVAGAVAISTFAGERAASASVTSEVATMFVTNAIKCMALGATGNFGECLLTGEGSSYSLSSSDLTSIKDIVSEELDEHSLTELAAKSDGVISDASEYYRNETQSISALQQSYEWAESIHDDAEDVMDALVGYDLDGAKGYHVLSAIRQAMLVEMYNIEVAKNALGVDAGSGEYLLSDNDLSSFRENRIQSEAEEVASYLGDWSDAVDALFGSVYSDLWVSGNKLEKSECFDWPWHLSYYRNYSSQWCYSDPESDTGKTCYTYYYWGCSYVSGGNYDGDDDNIMKATAKIAHKNAKVAYRSDMIGELAYETIAEFQKTAEGDFEYCGNGTCSIGEIDDCSDDCTETSAATGTFDQLTSGASWATSAEGVLLKNEDAMLIWVSGGLFVVSSAWTTIWQSYTTGASLLSFQSDGNLCIYKNNQYVWGTQTTASDGNSKATKMVLVGTVLHLVDADGVSIWNSDTDWNRHSAGYDGSGANTNNNSGDAEDTYSGRFCIDNSARTTLLKNGDRFGWYRYKLDFQTDGNLVVYDGNANAKWQSYTFGAKYLCSQEDGNLVIYNEDGAARWNSATAFTGAGSQLQLVREQLRVTSASGDILWVSGDCTVNDCASAASGTLSFSVATSGSSQTILSTEKAKLILTSGGYLQIVDKTTDSVLWTSSVSGAAASFASGTLKVGSTSINSTAGSKLYLVDCNLFIGDSTNNQPVYSTNTTCD